jgi:hypothetical protein
MSQLNLERLGLDYTPRAAMAHEVSEIRARGINTLPTGELEGNYKFDYRPSDLTVIARIASVRLEHTNTIAALSASDPENILLRVAYEDTHHIVVNLRDFAGTADGSITTLSHDGTFAPTLRDSTQTPKFTFTQVVTVDAGAARFGRDLEDKYVNTATFRVSVDAAVRIYNTTASAVDYDSLNALVGGAQYTLGTQISTNGTFLARADGQNNAFNYDQVEVTFRVTNRNGGHFRIWLNGTVDGFGVIKGFALEFRFGFNDRAFLLNGAIVTEIPFNAQINVFDGLTHTVRVVLDKIGGFVTVIVDDTYLGVAGGIAISELAEDDNSVAGFQSVDLNVWVGAFRLSKLGLATQSAAFVRARGVPVHYTVENEEGSIGINLADFANAPSVAASQFTTAARTAEYIMDNQEIGPEITVGLGIHIITVRIFDNIGLLGEHQIVLVVSLIYTAPLLSAGGQNHIPSFASPAVIAGSGASPLPVYPLAQSAEYNTVSTVFSLSTATVPTPHTTHALTSADFNAVLVLKSSHPLQDYFELPAIPNPNFFAAAILIRRDPESSGWLTAFSMRAGNAMWYGQMQLAQQTPAYTDAVDWSKPTAVTSRLCARNNNIEVFIHQDGVLLYYIDIRWGIQWSGNQGSPSEAMLTAFHASAGLPYFTLFNTTLSAFRFDFGVRHLARHDYLEDGEFVFNSGATVFDATGGARGFMLNSGQDTAYGLDYNYWSVTFSADADEINTRRLEFIIGNGRPDLAATTRGMSLVFERAQYQGVWQDMLYFNFYKDRTNENLPVTRSKSQFIVGAEPFTFFDGGQYTITVLFVGSEPTTEFDTGHLLAENTLFEPALRLEVFITDGAGNTQRGKIMVANAFFPANPPIEYPYLYYPYLDNLGNWYVASGTRDDSNNSDNRPRFLSTTLYPAAKITDAVLTVYSFNVLRIL